MDSRLISVRTRSVCPCMVVLGYNTGQRFVVVLIKLCVHSTLHCQKEVNRSIEM